MKIILIIIFSVVSWAPISAQPTPGGKPPINIPCNNANNPFCPDVSPVPIKGIEVLLGIGVILGYTLKKRYGTVKENT
jgi:hypothetical protein